MKIIQAKTYKSYIIKKRSNNKVSFVEFILNNRQFKLMTTGSQPHGARWPRFNCVQMIETMSLAAAVAIAGLNHLCTTRKRFTIVIKF